MADVVPAPVAPVPAAGSPGARAAPVVTVKPTAPAEVAKVATPPAEVPDLASERAKLDVERRAVQVKMMKQQKAHVEKEKSWGEKLSKLAEYERRDQLARLNPTEYLKGIYGAGWKEKLMEVQVHGTPPADLIASEVMKVREEMEAKFAAERDSRAKADADAKQGQVAEVERQLHSEGLGFWEASGKEFPVLEDLGDKEAIARTLTGWIRSKYDNTVKRDENGHVLAPGQILTMKQAAEEIEAKMLAIAEKAVKHDKYAARFTPQKPQVAVGAPVPQQQRRTLSNDLTASTSGRSAPANDNERRERALAAFEAVRSKAAP